MKDLALEFRVSQNKVIRTLGVSKSTVYSKLKGYPPNRSSKKERSREVIDAIRKICRERPSYGTPRVNAILKRDYSITLTRYMTYTMLKELGLLIDRHSKLRSRRDHTGQISVSKPNVRWASDITTIKCWDGSKGRFAVVIDCCDRSIISWKFSKTMQASDIEGMVEEAILKRFPGEIPNAKGLELLHDNGPEYIEHTLQKSLLNWNVIDCRTPTYSPQSNGLCEAFNGTFKRDYVYLNCLDSFEVVKGKINYWINDYNKFAPHSALNMKTPVELYEELKAA